MEAASVTGPAKNLISFGRWLKSEEGAKAGLNVTIATFDRNATTAAGHGFADAARAAGIEAHVIRERFRFDPGVLSQLRQIAAREQPNIIQTHNIKSHLLVKLLPDIRAQRWWFAFQHGHTYIDRKQRLYNQVDRLTLREADRVVSVCHAMIPGLMSFGVRRDRIRVLHNAAQPIPHVSDLERSRLRTELGVDSNTALILAVGRLSLEKGHLDLVHAVARLRASPRAWKLVLCGVGPEEAALEGAARSLGISERVVLAGFHANIAPFFSIADLFVLPSHLEGSANVLLEAMMAKLPIVASRAGGNPEIVLDGKTGLLVPIADPRALADAIERLLRDPDLGERLAVAARDRAAREFSPERYRQRLCEFYSEILQTIPAAGQI